MSIIVPFSGQITHDEFQAWQQAFSANSPSFRIVPIKALQKKEGHKVALVANPDPKEITLLSDLVWVQSLWAGVERLLAEPALDQIGICRLIDPQLATTMAEAVLAWCFYLHRDMPKYKTQQQNKYWKALPYIAPQQKKVGLLGLGELGRAAARRLAENGFQTLGWSRSEKHIKGVRCFHGASGLKTMVKQCDILVCLLPLTSTTHNLIDYQLLDALPVGASLINFGRGPIINTAALQASLATGHIDHAVLDVFETEPLAQDSPLWINPRITILPHISAPTTIETATAIAASNILTFLDDGSIPKLVDKIKGY